ncbi:putative ADP-ribosylation factor GTPase-activating protein AGD5 isoform X1 [Canna indica]|uniref:ADP-ribosylation factor GTPase-activating protein AGD5 isoform X1 n=1 Tax=Canna indica TaxID=4628 RepID=A0AAQ3KVW3_9LILI|nr:putative ADP-ribosylation factor GTPase-activating protein AGD5 isoform X1 [Canna indica]
MFVRVVARFAFAHFFLLRNSVESFGKPRGSDKMNEKASVSKELDAKHKKILEGLLKLPDNKECADCKSKGPRWASVNLGVFLCMQCSGIHRSLGVHISKVRSAALDTWLPEQVAFIQTMGNKKANSYWEAELPPNYDRVGIENFIRAKYEDKRWVPRDKKFVSPAKAQEEMYSDSQQKFSDTDADEDSDSVRVPEKKDKTPQMTRKDNLMIPKLPSPVSSESKMETGRTNLHSPEVAPVVVNATTTTPQKVNRTADLLDMLSVDDPSENGTESSMADDSGWANFQSAELTSPLENNSTTKSVESKNETATGVEDLFKDSANPLENNSSTKSVESKNQTALGVEDLFKNSTNPLENNNAVKSIESNTVTAQGVEDLFKDPTSLLQPSAEKKTQPDVKNDIMSLFDKSNMVSPFAHHQQQLAFLSQQQAQLMGSTNSVNLPSTLSSVGSHQRSVSDSNMMKGSITDQGWVNAGYQVPSNVRLAGQLYSNSLNQQMGNVPHHQPSGSYGLLPVSGLNALESAAPAGINKPQTSSLPPTASEPSLSEYDFSSLTQGLFSKR